MSAILSWRYEGDYALYDLSPDDRSTLMDPGSCYWSIHRAGMLIGYVCVGSEARVAGMTADENFVDVGLGIRPNITGRGASRALLAATLAALEQCLGSDSFLPSTPDSEQPGVTRTNGGRTSSSRVHRA